MKDSLEERVERAKAMIERIEMIKSFLPYKEIRKVRNTYKKHSFRDIEKIPNYGELLYAVNRYHDLVQVDNPNGLNYGFDVADLDRILNNYRVTLRKYMNLN